LPCYEFDDHVVNDTRSSFSSTGAGNHRYHLPPPSAAPPDPRLVKWNRRRRLPGGARPNLTVASSSFVVDFAGAVEDQTPYLGPPPNRMSGPAPRRRPLHRLRSRVASNRILLSRIRRCRSISAPAAAPPRRPEHVPVWSRTVRSRGVLAEKRPNCYMWCRLNAQSRVMHGHRVVVVEGPSPSAQRIAG
jgi:hypothetical protein